MTMSHLRNLMRNGLIAVIACVATAAHAGTITVTSPTDSAFVGANNTVRFNITGSVVEVRVTGTVTGPGGPFTTFDNRFTPDSDGRVTGSFELNFNQSSPEGTYTIQLNATEPGNPYNTPPLISVTLDRTRPKFLQVNPLNNSFVKGVVPIRVNVKEPNFKEAKVEVNGASIPNNVVTSLINGGFTVNWDTTLIENDGEQTINLKIKDLADNEETQGLTVTLDRRAPVVTIQQPVSTVQLPPKSNVSVAIGLSDIGGTVDATGVDVVARTTGGQFITRISRVSYRNISAGQFSWTGRLRWRGSLPKEFKIVVTAIDRAGNSALVQEVLVRYR